MCAVASRSAALQGAGREVNILPNPSRSWGQAALPWTVATAVNKTYPIARPLLMYTAGTPEPKVKAYLDWILSDEGQNILLEEGYAPIRKLK